MLCHHLGTIPKKKKKYLEGEWSKGVMKTDWEGVLKKIGQKAAKRVSSKSWQENFKKCMVSSDKCCKEIQWDKD